MIKLLRVDDRLIHGQVAVVWTAFLQAKTIVIANDAAANDPTMTMILGLAKPPGVALIIKNIADSVAYLNDAANTGVGVFVVVNCTDDALNLCKNVAEIKSVVCGGMRNNGTKKIIDRQVFMNESDLDNCDAMIEMGKSVIIQIVPSEKTISIKDARSIFNRK